MAGRNEAIAERFGRNLRRCRRRQDMGQERLSEFASLHRTEIGQLERGLRVPRIDTLLRLAGALEVSADRLLDGIVWVPREHKKGKFIFPSQLGPVVPLRIGEPDG
jgi:transcriptional regulator with XRE-family HTH domain